MKRVLECSTRGGADGRLFSAFIARVEVNGIIKTIEEHYQLSKRFVREDGSIIIPKDIKDGKGRRPDCFEVSGIIIPVDYIGQYYDLLWYKCLKANSNLEKILERYDDYNDMFKPRQGVCQADSIRKYMNKEDGTKFEPKERGKELYEGCIPFIRILQGKDTVPVNLIRREIEKSITPQISFF